MHPLAAHLDTLLGPLPEPVRALAAQARAQPLARGAALLGAGQHWRQLWWVAEGGVRLYYLDRQGRSANKNFHLAGTLLWPITPDLAGRPVDFWVEALAPSQVWGVAWPDWVRACADWPAWQLFERQVLAGLLQEKMRREQQLLQLSATARYQALRADRPDWVSQVPLRHLASYLGITDVALSRIRRRLNPG